MATKERKTTQADDAAVEEQSTAQQAGLPLFFQKPAALEKVRHAQAGLVASPDLSFAAGTNSISVTTLEFLEAAKHYPIVFTPADVPMPLAIVGLETLNYFVDTAGLWREGTYIPAYVRQYPFIFFENTEEQRFYLCVDEQSAQFRTESGEGVQPLFNTDGTPSPLANQALEFCQSYYRHHSITQNFTADLKKHNLLQPYESKATLNSGRTISLTGFTMIDETAFNALSAEIFAEFRSKGWLPFIYFALASTSNWKQLYAIAEQREPAGELKKH